MWFRVNRCPHERLFGVYGDQIHRSLGTRLVCGDCGRSLDGPVSIARDRGETQRLVQENEQLGTANATLRAEVDRLSIEKQHLESLVDAYDDAEDALFKALARAGEAEQTLTLVRNVLVNTAGCTWDEVWAEDLSQCVARIATRVQVKRAEDAVATLAYAQALQQRSDWAAWFAAEARYLRREVNRWIANTQFFAGKSRDYEDGISWDTACLTCSRLLDHCYAADMKNEAAGRKFAALRALLSDAQQHYWNDNDLVGTLISHAAVTAILDAADDTEMP